MSLAELIASLRLNRDFMNNVVAWERMSARPSATQPVDLPPQIRQALQQRGIDQLFTHQAEAVTAVSQNQNVVIATTTSDESSTGKTGDTQPGASQHRAPADIPPAPILRTHAVPSGVRPSAGLNTRNILYPPAINVLIARTLGYSEFA